VTGGTASTSAFPSTSSAFNTTTTFGNDAAPSAFGAQASSATSAFGKPAFGQPAQPSSSFGQTGFGQTSTSVFAQPTAGQPSGGQQATTSAFGQPSFGQPNPLVGVGGTPSLIRPATGAFSAFAGSGPEPHQVRIRVAGREEVSLRLLGSLRHLEVQLGAVRYLALVDHPHKQPDQVRLDSSNR
jgi:hypothetical protein